MNDKYVLLGTETADSLDALFRERDGVEEILLTKTALLALLDRFLASELSASELEAIAETLDANDSISFDDNHRQALVDAIFALSSSEINGPVTKERVLEVRDSIA